jgi:hypothetical protein
MQLVHIVKVVVLLKIRNNHIRVWAEINAYENTKVHTLKLRLIFRPKRIDTIKLHLASYLTESTGSQTQFCAKLGTISTSFNLIIKPSALDARDIFLLHSQKQPAASWRSFPTMVWPSRPLNQSKANIDTTSASSTQRLYLRKTKTKYVIHTKIAVPFSQLIVQVFFDETIQEVVSCQHLGTKHQIARCAIGGKPKTFELQGGKIEELRYSPGQASHYVGVRRAGVDVVEVTHLATGETMVLKPLWMQRDAPKPKSLGFHWSNPSSLFLVTSASVEFFTVLYFILTFLSNVMYFLFLIVLPTPYI